MPTVPSMALLFMKAEPVRWRLLTTVTRVSMFSVLEPPRDGVAALAYDYEGWPSRLGLVRGRRWQRLSLVDGRTRYDTVEEFSGPLVGLAGPGRVAEGFRRHADGLRARAEALHATR